MFSWVPQSESPQEDAITHRADCSGDLIAGQFLPENVEDVWYSAVTGTAGELHKNHWELKIIFPYPAISLDT